MTKKFEAILLSMLMLLAAFSCGFSDSLWKNDSSSSYTPDKSFKVGDIVTVIIQENTAAQHKAATNTNVKDDLGLQFTHTIQRLNPLISGNNNATFQGSNKYTGSGSTQRTSNVESKVAASVTEVMNNGNLKIEGHHSLVVNDENQEIILSGVVRSKDISVANTIYSYQVADANVSVKGIGSVQEAESPGWLTRIFNWIF